MILRIRDTSTAANVLCPNGIYLVSDFDQTWSNPKYNGLSLSRPPLQASVSSLIRWSFKRGKLKGVLLRCTKVQSTQCGNLRKTHTAQRMKRSTSMGNFTYFGYFASGTMGKNINLSFCTLKGQSLNHDEWKALVFRTNGGIDTVKAQNKGKLSTIPQAKDFIITMKLDRFHAAYYSYIFLQIKLWSTFYWSKW